MVELSFDTAQFGQMLLDHQRHLREGIGVPHAKLERLIAASVDAGPVLVSCDIGNSGKVVTPCVVSGLMGSGCEVVDSGIYPTAASQLAV